MQKTTIFEFIKEQLSSEFEGKVYWAGERKNEPKKPFCLLQDIVPEQTTSRTTEIAKEGNIQEVIMYKSMVVTVAIYVDGIAEVEDLDVKKSFAKNSAVKVKNSFESLDTAFTFLAAGMSVNAISELRDLSETISGGYLFRYEFDVTFGFDDTYEIQKQVGKDVVLNIERKD